MQLWFRTSITCGTHHRRRAFARHSKAFHSFCTLFLSTGKNFQQQPFAYIFRAEKAFSFTYLQHFSHLMEILFGNNFQQSHWKAIFHFRSSACGLRLLTLIFSGTRHQRAFSHSLISHCFLLTWNEALWKEITFLNNFWSGLECHQMDFGSTE